MASHDDIEALDARLDAVHSWVLSLNARVDALEGTPGVPVPVAAQDTPVVAHPVVPVIAEIPVVPLVADLPEQPATEQPVKVELEKTTEKIEAPVAPKAAEPREAAAPKVDKVETQPAPASAPATQLELETGDEGRELDPMRLLAAAGGAAMLVGFAFFVGYAIEQGWLSPGVRFVLATLASALLTASAWPVAKRGHGVVAGALGGAGLGAWFATWLVARHAHELVSAGQTFVALGVGAAACLVIADGLRLRLMARLATVAACATPLLVPATVDRLGELMVYQLVVVGGAMVLDQRRRWSELPTLALLSTWALGGRWLGLHVHDAGLTGADQQAPYFLVWSVALLLASAASAWRLVAADLFEGFEADGDVETQARERNHAVVRLLVAGLATWAVGAWISVDAPVMLAGGTLALAAWHGALAAMLRRQGGPMEPARSELENMSRAKTSRVFGVLAWVQAFLVAPFAHFGAFDRGDAAIDAPGVALWWLVMAGLALAVHLTGERERPWTHAGWIVVPALAALGWSLAYAPTEDSWVALTGGLAAALPLVAGLWPRESSEEGARFEEPHVALTVLGTLMWIVGAAVLVPGGVAVKLGVGALPVLAALARAGAGGEIARSLATWLSFGAVVLCTGLLLEFDALTLTKSKPWGELHPLAVVVPMLAVGLGGLFVELRSDQRGPGRPEGLAIALTGAATLAAMGLVAGLAEGLGLGTDGGVGLARLGYTLCVAGAGLGLLVAGLRAEVELWRQLGLSAIVCAAVKVVAFDLATAGVLWRALSFVAIGGVLIGGAFAYSRARQRSGGTVSAR